MSVLAWRKAAPGPSQYDHDEDDAEDEEFFAGERICAPTEETRGGFALRLCVVVLIAACGWGFYRNSESLQGWLSTKIGTSSALLEYKSADPVAPVTPDHAALPERAPTAGTAPTLAHTPVEMAATGDATAQPQTAPQPLTTIATRPAAKEFSVSSHKPAAQEQTNPYRARAVAAGLNPDLSPVLLSRLSQADYSNARTAIDTAIARTPDSGTFVWPRQRQPELALFQVRFVPGAAPTCRRYVVTVTKERWSTTASPVERCGTNVGVHQR
jgi:hypothetical protein